MGIEELLDAAEDFLMKEKDIKVWRLLERREIFRDAPFLVLQNLYETNDDLKTEGSVGHAWLTALYLAGGSELERGNLYTDIEMAEDAVKAYCNIANDCLEQMRDRKESQEIGD